MPELRHPELGGYVRPAGGVSCDRGRVADRADRPRRSHGVRQPDVPGVAGGDGLRPALPSQRLTFLGPSVPEPGCHPRQRALLRLRTGGLRDASPAGNFKGNMDINQYDDVYIECHLNCIRQLQSLVTEPTLHSVQPHEKVTFYYSIDNN